VTSQAISHYRVIDRPGSGGMGDVYLATDVRPGRKVALKLLRSELTTNEDGVLLFDQEARAASALSPEHPHHI
jgi:eukaryotic-like serine/threonine-protein kinase